MAGYHTLETLRPILHRGPPPTPVVNRALVQPKAPVTAKSSDKIDRGRYYVTNAMVARMTELRQMNVSLRLVAEEMGCAESTVRYYTKDLPPPPGGWSKGAAGKRGYDVRLARRLRVAGTTYKKISEVIGCSEGAAYELLNPRGIKRRGLIPRMSRYVQLVSSISGVPCKDLRCPAPGAGKKGDATVSKARALLFWAVRVSCGRAKFTHIGRVLGGFEGTTVADGVNRVERVVKRHDLVIPAVPARLARELWLLDWSEPQQCDA